jgi:hypothetical protein
LENNNDRSNLMGRRRVLQVIGAGLSAAAGGLVVLGGCNKSGGQAATGGESAGGGAAKGGSCQDRVEVDETAAQLRKTLQYKEKSDTQEKKCSGCAQFEANKYGDCGGCKLFAGGVNPEGVCLSYAPKAAPGAAPAAAPGAAPAAPAPAPAKAG